MHHCLRPYRPFCVVLALNVLLGAISLLAATSDGLPSAYWKFDELSGTSAIDSATNGHTGTVVGAVRVPGKMGGALSFNGVSDYVFASDVQSGGTTGAGLDMGA